MRTILSRSYTIYSNESYLHEEVKHVESTFKKVNNYPKYVLNRPNREVKLKRSTINQTVLNEQEERHLLILPYTGNKGEKILKLMNKFLSQVLPCNIKTCIAYCGTKLNNRFQLKD